MAVTRNIKIWSPGMRKLYIVILVAFINSANNGYDGSMLSSINAFQEYLDFFHIGTSGSGASLVTSIYNVGGIFGGLFAGPLSDFWGRRWGMTIGCLLIVIGSALQAAALDLNWLLVGRVIVGFGVPITVTAAPVWVAELSPSEIRGTLTGLYNTWWFVGSSFATITALGVESFRSDLRWRLPLACQAIPSILVIIFMAFIPESPRWLISRGRVDEARKILAKYQAEGDEKSPIVEQEVNGITEAIELEKASKSGRWINLVNSRPALHRLLITFTVAYFQGNSVISYYYVDMLKKAGITDTVTLLVIQYFLSIVSWVAAIVGASTFTDRLGRRKMALIGIAGPTLGMSIIAACTSQAIDTPNLAATIGVVVFIYLLNVIYSLTWTPLQALYPTEIYPFSMRAKGVGVTQFFFATGGFVSNYSNGIGLENLSWKYYFIIMAWNSIWFVLAYFFFPETKGRTMEELTELFDSPSPVKESLKIREAPEPIPEVGEISKV